MSIVAILERGAAPLDELRRQWFALLLRSGVSSLVVRRDRRLAATLTLQAGVTLALAIYLPVFLFVLGPIVVGVAHVAADVRYLVLRQRLAAWWQRSVLFGCLCLIALHALQYARVLRISGEVELGLILVWVGVAVVAGALQSRAWLRAALALLLAAAVTAAAFRWIGAWRVVFLHVHNLVVLAVWPLFYRSRPRLLWLALGLILALAALLGSGVFYKLPLAVFAGKQFGIHVLQIADAIAPNLRADYAIGLTSAFVFLQAIHYTFWLNVIPQGEIRGEGTLTFRMTLRSLLADFGPWGLSLVTLVMLSIIGGACVNAPSASRLYMSLAMFHGYLELALLAYFWVARRPLDLHGARAPVPSPASA